MKIKPLQFIKIQRVRKGTALRIAIGKLNIYFSLTPMAIRPPGYTDKRKFMITAKSRLFKERGVCQMCGKKLEWKEASLHHTIPRHIAPELCYDLNNLQLLCCDCHLRIHQVDGLLKQHDELCRSRR